jgi:hypothetical protein
MNGLGSNTCIQDAFNLAWKVAYVHRGLAPAALLDTYSSERQPVGRAIITRANEGFRDHFGVWESLGVLAGSAAAGKAVLEELGAATSAGSERRRALQAAIANTAHEFHGLGIEMGQVYAGEGVGVYAADEANGYERGGRAAADEVLYHQPSTYPGCRLPHVWLNTAVPQAATSTIDLAGHGAFTLLTGIGGAPWKAAAASVTARLGVPLGVHSIGFRQDWQDVYSDWARIRGVDESGAVLVRPDRVVAWRSAAVLDSVEACQAKLEQVLRAVLGHH